MINAEPKDFFGVTILPGDTVAKAITVYRNAEVRLADCR